MPFARERFFQVLVLFTGAIIWAVALGCQRTVPAPSFPDRKATQEASTADDPNQMRFDVGKVIAGQIVRHDFVISNPSSQRIAILEDKDIRPGCGCSELKPSTRSLEPGARANVSVSVNTRSLTGSFRYGGNITWTAADGGKRTVTMVLFGESQPALVCTPDELRFSHDEIHRGTVKEFRVAGTVPIDWSSLTATGEASFQIQEVRREADAARCLVKCRAPADLESVVGVVRLTARVADRSAVPGLDTVAAVIPLSARQTIDLQVTPQTVPLSLDAAGAKGTARLLLRGARVVPGKPLVRTVRCDGYRVEWAAGEATASKTAVLEITATPVGALSQKPILVIEFVGGPTLHLPIVEVRSAGARSGTGA